ncbi:histidine phosphatase family protein [Fodinicola feengrottensis]|uniref:Histidine phosphatase family protein n=1 Tax=Fodinicola feengrottensis TaxID=435914 RepID=A0ABN2GT74_9ACTN|nr:histidine phosphatase family protein [Fodinicola feengrottensis]
MITADADGREIIAVRHGQSEANAAFGLADRTGVEPVGMPDRDADVLLTETGRGQSAALGRWLGTLPPSRQPQLVYCSVFRRAQQTAELALAALAESGGPAVPTVPDERLRDRDMGQFELLTAAAIRRRFPAESARRDRLGDLYYRPPGGESLADVAFRMRAVLTDIRRRPERCVLLVGHDAVVLMLRYVLEGLDERELRTVIRDNPVRNTSVTRWRDKGDECRLVDYNLCDHLR